MKDRQVGVRLTENEKNRMEQAALREDKTLSEWLRELGRREIGRESQQSA